METTCGVNGGRDHHHHGNLARRSPGSTILASTSRMSKTTGRGHALLQEVLITTSSRFVGHNDASNVSFCVSRSPASRNRRVPSVWPELYPRPDQKLEPARMEVISRRSTFRTEPGEATRPRRRNRFRSESERFGLSVGVAGHLSGGNFL